MTGFTSIMGFTSRLHRYGPGAGVYDVVSMERLLYRFGRVAAIGGLRLRPGDRVLDVGCGTGLSLPALAAAVGPAGEVVGLDASGAMLARAQHRRMGRGMEQVRLVQADAARLDELAAGPFDAVLFAYSLAIIEPWRDVWRQALGLVRPGGRVAVADTDWPTGRGRLVTPLVAVALWIGGVHPGRRVWQLVDDDTDDVTRVALRCGHIRVAVGTIHTTTGADTADE